MNRIKKKLASSAFISMIFAPLISLAGPVNHEEKNGLLVIEAEDYAHQAQDSIRRWYRFDASTPRHNMVDADTTHLKGASGGAYLELLPDDRTNHDEELIHEVNFTDKPGVQAILSYPVYFNTPGTYIIWARAYSTGKEDNGLHFGLDGQWPESSRRVQYCKGKFQWTWSSAQRRPDNHCGDQHTIEINVDKPGIHTLHVSMREDGVELDKIILTQDKKFVPKKAGPNKTVSTQLATKAKTKFLNVQNYSYIMQPHTDFKISEPAYHDKERSAFAIKAHIKSARDIFVGASHTWGTERDGKYNLTLIALTETDGESNYRIKRNGKVIGKFKNPETRIDYHPAYFTIKNVKAKAGDVFTVESKAVTNGKIPENDETAYSRGRWRALIFNNSKNAPAIKNKTNRK